IKGVRDYCIQNQKPYLVECMTFRMRGHEEASGTKYVPTELFTEWALKEPVKSLEQFLVSIQVLTGDAVNEIKESFKSAIDEELKNGFDSPAMFADEDEELEDVYAIPSKSGITILDNSSSLKHQGIDYKESRLIDAIKEGLHQSMQHHDHLILMGQDIAEYGGAFKITEGFVHEFGKQRVRNTPLCESAIVGTALGLSLEGFKSVMEMQFADFVSVGFNQIINNMAKINYRWGQNADVVIRMPTGAGVGAG